MIKLILDCFGGDNSPSANIGGAVAALSEKDDLFLILTGDRNKIETELAKYSYDKSRITVSDAPDIVDCSLKPTDAIRQQKDSSLVRAITLLRENDDISGMVSIGSTGVVLVGSVLRVGRVRGVLRPAFCPILPTMNGGVVGVCDSGANVECDADYLHQFAVMGSLYMQKICGIKNPRVALLNVGTEESKGDTLRQQAFALLKNDSSLNFCGNMESRDLLSGKFDLVVCDGFSGNVLIKSTEGACLEMLKKLKHEIDGGSLRTKLGALLMKKMLMKQKSFMNYQNYGGSVMLGTRKVVVKGHGSSKALGVHKCIIQAYTMAQSGLCTVIEEEIEKSIKGTVNDNV